MADPIRLRIARLIAGPHALGSVSVRVDDSPGWSRYGTLLDRDWSELYKDQTDALTAWRTNPLAKRIIALTTDYVVSDGITLDSVYNPLSAFIRKFWTANQMDLRLPEMCNELTRAGELFPVLSFDPAGMSLIRFKPASSIDRLEWAPEDYETELRYHEVTDGSAGRWWHAPRATDDGSQVMLHYAVNRPIGCTRGESDLTPILVWLRRYSGWLEDRVRLNWAARAFLYNVTVPSAKVDAKAHQYARPPEPGSVIVHDEGEKWEMLTPSLNANDASADGRAIRYMVGAGAGVPLHMLAEGENTNLATATAMQEPTFRQYSRRQLYFCYVLRDIIIHAYEHHRRHTGEHRSRAATHDMITASVPEISKADNSALAAAGRSIVGMLADLRNELRASGIGPSDDLNRRTVELAFRFAGEILDAEEIAAILAGPRVDPPAAAPAAPAADDTPDTPPDPAEETPPDAG